MDDTINLLVTVLNGDDLVRCAMQIDADRILPEHRNQLMEYRAVLHDLLPLHVQSCGPIVEVRKIFEICIR